MVETSEKYRADERKWEDKQWLREAYWGQRQSAADIAENFDVCQETIRATMEQLGIHRRVRYWKRQAKRYHPRQEEGWGIVDDEETVWVQAVDRDIVTVATA